MRGRDSYRPWAIQSLFERLTRRELLVLGLLAAALLWGAAGRISGLLRPRESPLPPGFCLYRELLFALPDPDFVLTKSGTGRAGIPADQLTRSSYPGVPEVEVYEDRWIFFPRDYYTTVNVNEAGREELMTLPGIGPATARRILFYRQRYVGFSRVKALKRIRGIGDRTLERLEGKIRLY